MEPSVPSKIGDRSTSDLVVRLRTEEGRDDWFYCHSHILIEKSEYFAERLSQDWPTCQIIGSRNCVEVYCQESEYDEHVILLRLLYEPVDASLHEKWHGVKNALGILQAAVKLGCPQIVSACVIYLEAVPWEEAEEEEILRIIPSMGSEIAEGVLARVQPVNATLIWRIFMSTFQFATSSPPSTLNDHKTSAQEQLEYMLTEDDDAPLIVPDDEIKSEVKECVKRLFTRFHDLLEALLCEPVESVFGTGKMLTLQSYLSDLSWACQILNKLEIMMEFINNWVDESHKIVEVVKRANSTAEIIDTKSRVIEVAAKALEAIGYGTVILPTAKRHQMVKVWLPFVRAAKPLIDSVTTNAEAGLELKIDGEVWQSLESTFVSIVLTLPSEAQAEILAEWLGNEHVDYPDFTEAFEVWCYRSKNARSRLAGIPGNNGDVDTHP